MENNNRQGCRWVNRGDKSLSEWLPKDGEQYLFDGDEQPPMWARVKWNGKHPCLVVLDSSGEEEYEDAEGYNRYCDNKATPSPTDDRDCEELKKEVERLKNLCAEAFKAGDRFRKWIYHGNGQPPKPPDINEFKKLNNL